jgi:hypothetical protein
MLRLTEILDPLVPYADNSVAAIKRVPYTYLHAHIFKGRIVLLNKYIGIFMEIYFDSKAINLTRSLAHSRAPFFQ